MRDAFYLALAYLAHQRLKTAILVLAAAMILIMPLMTRIVLERAETLLASRAEATPLVIGARGSALDVLMNALYFTDDRPARLTMAASEKVWDSGHATALPIYQLYRSGGLPIVGTTLDYLDFRRLEVSEGRHFAMLGEAVLGARAARRLGVDVGDRILSDPQNLFDLTGSYPLRMPVVGILAVTGTADDQAIFVDLKTTWVIEGLGHGHDDLGERPGMVLRQDDGTLVANSALELANEITAENARDFHFHGDPADYPITAVIAVPPNARASALLRGRYVLPGMEEQIIVAEDVIEGLLVTVFRIGQLLDGAIAIAAIAAIIAMVLAIYLSLQLRRDELTTIARLGGRRGQAMLMVIAELVIVLGMALLLAFALSLATLTCAGDIAAWLLDTAR